MIKLNSNQCHNTDKVSALKQQLQSYSHQAELERHKALANGIRLDILHLLQQQSCCVCDLSHALELHIATISQHLKILKQANFIDSKREGKFQNYKAI